MHALLPYRWFALWLFIASFAARSAGADVDTFVWGFQTVNVTTIQECDRIQIFVGAHPEARGPYTLIAYEANGFTTNQTMGSDLSNLWWNVDHSAGSRLILSMVDGVGNPGGVAAELYTVINGATTTCHPANPTSPVSITTNTTSTLNSCDVLPLKVTGGQKPYTMIIAALNSTSATNVSMAQFDQYNWVNRVTPGSQLIATVQDANGKYAAATTLLSTTGSADLSCGGRVSTLIDSSGKSASQPGPGDGRNSNPSGGGDQRSKPKGALIGGIAAGVVLVGVLFVGLFFFLWKRNSRPKGPRVYLEEPHEEYGLGGTAERGNYASIPIAEEITPFVMTGRQTTPYGGHDANTRTTQDTPSHYQQSSSSTGHDTLASNSSQPDQLGRLTTPLQPGAAALPQIAPGAASRSTFDSYEPSPDMPAGLSAYNAGAVHPSALASGAGAVSGSATGPIAGGSGSTGLVPVEAAGGQHERRSDTKGGAGPSQRPQTVFQHEDVADVEELPPAYKERPA